MKPSNIVVRAFEDLKRMVHGEVYIPIKVGTQTYDSTFYLTPRGRKHNEALHVSVECRRTTLAHVLVDIGSSLNVCLKKLLIGLTVRD